MTALDRAFMLLHALPDAGASPWSPRRAAVTVRGIRSVHGVVVVFGAARCGHGPVGPVEVRSIR
jgi:hypothetical protein